MPIVPIRQNACEQSASTAKRRRHSVSSVQRVRMDWQATAERT